MPGRTGRSAMAPALPASAPRPHLGAFAVLLVLACVLAGTIAREVRDTSVTDAERADAVITVDVAEQYPMPEDFYGIFFEEIQHAGEGGLYAELVQDRSFDALAFTQGFLDSQATELPLSPDLFEDEYLHLESSVLHTAPPLDLASTNRSLVAQMWAHAPTMNSLDTSQPVSWRPLHNTSLALTKGVPVNNRNVVAMEVTSGGEGGGGISNTGFWGIHVIASKSYHLSVYLRVPVDDDSDAPAVSVSLESADGAESYAYHTFYNISKSWAQHQALLMAEGSDHSAQLVLRLHNATSVLVDMVSLFPEENGAEGAVSPFRADILELLRGLHPRFLRVPGGCYVEGVTMADGYFWKPSVGPLVQRPGHWNGPWRYWSTDGLGLFEYMQLAEALEAEPVWVLNNGLSHAQSVPSADAWPLVKDALNSLEFVLGPSDSRWGAVRAKMGREEPWALHYVGIGNEDCGKPFYASNYNLFYGAIKARYPHMQLVANCHMGAGAPTELWDWHWYTDPDSMFRGRAMFDAWEPAEHGAVFASEYAVFDWGIATKPAGSLQGAIAEAAFMTGMERNARVIKMAAYAPLLANVNHAGSCPTNLVVFDNHRAFGDPSYYVQALFAQHQGAAHVNATVHASQLDDGGLATSATCQDAACAQLALKVVNYKAIPQTVSVQLLGIGGVVAPRGTLTTLTGAGAHATNSFERPHAIFPSSQGMDDLASDFILEVPSYSISIIELSIRNGHTSTSADA